MPILTSFEKFPEFFGISYRNYISEGFMTTRNVRLVAAHTRFSCHSLGPIIHNLNSYVMQTKALRHINVSCEVCRKNRLAFFAPLHA
jgi:hypothetical protein